MYNFLINTIFNGLLLFDYLLTITYSILYKILTPVQLYRAKNKTKTYKNN